MSIKETKNQPQPFDLPTELLRLENKRAEIKAEQDGVSKALKYLHDSQEQETAILKPIQDKIKKGEVSTKDKIEDFCLVYFPEEPEKAKQLQQIETQMKEHKGEFILLTEIKHEAHGYIDFERNPKPHPELYHWEPINQIGIVNERTPLELDLENGMIVISSKKHSYINRFRSDKPSLKNEAISLHWSKLEKVGVSIESFYSKNRPKLFPSIYPTEEQINSQRMKNFPAIEIIIGDDNVCSYFKNRQDIYLEAAKQLGKKIRTPKT